MFKLNENSSIDEKTEKHQDTAFDLNTNNSTNDHICPDVLVKDRILKEVGFTSSAFIGPAFPPEIPKPKTDLNDSLSEFYKEIEKIDAVDKSKNISEKQDDQLMKPSEKTSSKQIVPAEKSAKENEAIMNEKSVNYSHKSWSHWYPNEPYSLNRPRPQLNSIRPAYDQSQRYHSPTENRPMQPQLHHHPFPSQTPYTRFPHPHYPPPPPRANIPIDRSGRANQDWNRLNFPSNLHGEPSVSFHRNPLQHFGSDRRSYEMNLDSGIDKSQTFDSDNKQWEHHPQSAGPSTYPPAPVLILMRGLPGSGKTTLARQLLSSGPNGVMLSTDDYFVQRGNYHYDLGLLGAAHDWNQKRADDVMRKGRSPVIIDNTNLQAWEMKPYVKMALEKGYRVNFREPSTPWKFDPAELEKRNKHGVSQEKITLMMDRFSFPISVEIVMNSQEPSHLHKRGQQTNRK